MHTRAYLAEFLGTFLFFGLGLTAVQAIGAVGAPGAPLLLVVPFAFGFGLLAAIFAVGHISGGHFNPAVTLAMLIDRRIGATDAAGYMVAQLAGGIAAALLVLVLFDQAAVAGTITAPGNGFDALGALVLETVMTTFFLLVILAATKHASALAALAIPATLVVIHFAAVPFSGASVNPARSVGPALLGGDVSALWIYLVGPMVGGALAAVLYGLLSGREVERFGTQPREAPGSAV